MSLEDSELKLSDVANVLHSLSLKWVTVGKYIVVMNGKIDVELDGEPYLALQSWLNIKTGTIIGRIWGRTVACVKVASVAQLLEACAKHFKGQPCIGCPEPIDEYCLGDFIISQTPIPRKISRTCQGILTPGPDRSLQSCEDCLKLRNYEMKEILPEPEVCVTEKVFEEEVLEVKEVKQVKTVITVGNYVCESVDCGYKTKYLANLKAHCQNMSHQSSHVGFSDQQIQFQDHTPSPSQISPVIKTESTISHIKEQSDLCATSFTCETCGLTTWHRHQLERHKALFHGSSPVYKECEICGKIMRCNVFLEHMLVHDMKGPFFTKCVWCESNFSTNTFERHAKRKHFFGQFVCEKCTFSCNLAKDLVDHINKDHENQFAKCPCCKKDNPLEDLESHYRSCIVDKFDKKDQICATCGKTFGDKHKLRLHSKSHLRKEAKIKGDSSLSENLYHYCDKCDKKFSRPAPLRHHIQSLHENFKYTCSLCTKTLRTMNMKNMHKIQVHSTDKRYQCRFCDKRDSMSRIKIHERVHEDSKFQCNFCGKKMKSPDALEEHERYHTGEKPFKCPACDSAFVSNKRLGQHTRGVHKIIGPLGGKVGWNRKNKQKASDSITTSQTS